MRNLITTLICLLLAVPCAADIITVDDDGPADFNNIQAAIDDANDGDTIEVKPGTYTGPGNYNIDFKGKAITVRSENGPENCIIDGPGTEDGFIFRNGETRDSILNGLTIINCEDGIYIDESGPKILNCRIHSNKYRGVRSSESFPIISSCVISENDSGILSRRSSSVLDVRNCIIMNNDCGGIVCSDGAATILNCTIFNNNLSNSSCYGIAWYCVGSITNCIILDEIYVSYGKKPVVTYSITKENLDGEGNLNVDPKLTPDSHLSADSPCINAGDPNRYYDSLIDIDGEQRIYSERIDIGADEFIDSDSDGLADWWECKFFGSLVSADPNADPDDDGLTNLVEYLGYGSDPLLPSKTYYVDFNRPDDGGDGLSWETAKKTIQAAIELTENSDNVIIAPGIYNGVGNYNIIPNGRLITIRSTEPTSSSMVCSTIIDPDEAGRGFIFEDWETRYCILNGLTIRNGRYGNSKGGGGILCSWASPTIINCIIEDNFTLYLGAGISLFHSSALIENCSLNDNYVAYGCGGGISCVDQSNAKITNCIIYNNRCSRWGGGMHTDNSNPTLDNCMFIGNSAFQYASHGGGMHNTSANPVLTNCIFVGNSADSSGGIRNSHGKPIFKNCIFSGNAANSGHGGGMNNYDTNATLINCTFCGNLAGRKGGAIYNCLNSNSTFTNCILWENSDAGGNDESAQIDNDGPTPIINYSCIQGWTGGLGGIGNIGDDPCFVDTVIDDYHLLEGSPCIDTGDPNYVAESNETDLDGNPRVIAGRIDMGAYEYWPPVQAEMRITPQTLNCKSKGNWVKAHFVLPEGYTADDVDVEEPALAELPQATIDSEYIKVLGNDYGLVRLEIGFDRQVLCDLLTDGSIVSDNNTVEITVVGYLTTGQYFYGSDSIRTKH